MPTFHTANAVCYVLLADVAELTVCWMGFCTELISFTPSLASVMDYCHSSQSTAGRLPRSARFGSTHSPQLSFTLHCLPACLVFFLRVKSKVEVNNLSSNGELVGAISRYLFAFSVQNSCPLSLSNCVLSPFFFCCLAPKRTLRAAYEMGGFVFSLAVDVYQSFQSLYHISGLALPYGSLDSLTRLAVLSYLRIAVLCGLDRRCLWISPLLCAGFSKRMTTSRSRVEPCRTAISVACRINRL